MDLVTDGLGGQAFAFGKMVHRVALLPKFFAPLKDVYPGVIGLEYSENVLTHLRNEKSVAEKYLAHHFLGFEQALGKNGLDIVYRPPCMENPAGGLAKKK